MFLPGIIGEAEKGPGKGRSRLAWDREKCTLCGGCVPVCDPDAIAVFETFLEIDLSRCRLCGDCVRGCPTGALRIEGPQIREQGSGTQKLRIGGGRA